MSFPRNLILDMQECKEIVLNAACQSAIRSDDSHVCRNHKQSNYLKKQLVGLVKCFYVGVSYKNLQINGISKMIAGVVSYLELIRYSTTMFCKKFWHGICQELNQNEKS